MKDSAERIGPNGCRLTAMDEARLNDQHPVRPQATRIDVDRWPRREHFEHYLHRSPCTYSLTVELDVSKFVAAIASVDRRSYVSQVWAIAKLVNAHAEFKMCLTADDAPATWDVVHPAFTVFNTETETFSCLWVPFDSDYAAFHDRAAAVISEHRTSVGMFPQGQPPANLFDVSSLPWSSFTGFNLNIRDGWRHLAPIFTLGRYIERDGKTLLPLSVQVNHAAADGFHASRLVNELQEMFTLTDWL